MVFTTQKPLRLCVFGAGPGTGNLGVEALGLSLLHGIARRVEDAGVTLFDNGDGMRIAQARVGGEILRYRLCGAVPTRRIYRHDSLFRIRWSGWFGGLHPAIEAVRESDAVLDATSGDSFTDLYSRRRFRIVATEKLIALEQERPLILLPQTIGPFRHERSRRVARRILHRADMVWARDATSFETVQELLGADFNPVRHQCGVDMAFALDVEEPKPPLPDEVAELMINDGRPPLVGFNVSGLVHAGDDARQRFGLKADYAEAVALFLRRILDETDANVLLVPHVFTQPRHREHDPDACEAIAKMLGKAAEDRVTRLPDGLSPGKTKWAIGRTDWFCGTRMHTSIAALSTGVPAAAIAYSDKTLGVFETCGQGDHVVDPRQLDTDDVVTALWRSWERRRETRQSLTDHLPGVLARAEEQMDLIVQACVSPHAPPGQPVPAPGYEVVRDGLEPAGESGVRDGKKEEEDLCETADR
jgi:colanic acid/amylovoran biosynthesis protein